MVGGEQLAENTPMQDAARCLVSDRVFLGGVWGSASPQLSMNGVVAVAARCVRMRRQIGGRLLNGVEVSGPRVVQVSGVADNLSSYGFCT